MPAQAVARDELNCVCFKTKAVSIPCGEDVKAQLSLEIRVAVNLLKSLVGCEKCQNV